MIRFEDALNNPRYKALAAMQASIPAEAWASNQAAIASWRKELDQHPLMTHPVLKVLNSGTVSHKSVSRIHLDYRVAIVKVFTDALAMAMVQSRQLEPRLPSGSKIAARFLLTLNTLDELGFQPGLDKQSYYKGNPKYAHYPLFEEVLDNLGIGNEERAKFRPSKSASALLALIENSFDSYEKILTLLAVAEIQVILFSPALRKATEALGVDVESGYYFVHGTSTDSNVDAADDDHENDLWHALAQACTPTQFSDLRSLASTYMDLWEDFWDLQHEHIRQEAEEYELA